MCLTLIQGQSIQQPGQFMTLNGKNFIRCLRPSEPISFQPFMPETETVAIPVQNLDDIPFSIAKGKEVAGEK